MAKSRSEMRSNASKSSKRKKIWTTVLVVLFLLFVGLGVSIWKVYSDVAGTTDKIYAPVPEEVEEVRAEPVSVDNKEPFSVLLMGVDTGALGRTETGRSDTLMVATINPETNETKLVSIPRDTYTEIVGRGTKDKINHAYAFGGTAMAVNTVQNLLDIPIDYFVEVNMQGLQDIVDAVGGVTITSPLTFEYEGYTFTKGETRLLDGEAALAYSRMRYEDPQGDYGRQARQRQVIENVLQKAASLSSISNYRGVLGTMENNMQTSLTFDDMVDLFSNYRSAVNNMEQIQLSGSGTMMNGVYYEVLDEAQLAEVKSTLQGQLDL